MDQLKGVEEDPTVLFSAKEPETSCHPSPETTQSGEADLRKAVVGDSQPTTGLTRTKLSHAGLGCGSVAMLVEEGKIDTANYSGLYPRNTECHWPIETPAEYVVKLKFQDAVELSLGCIYDAVTLYGDEEEENQLEEAGREDSRLTTAPMLPLKDVPLVTPQQLFKCVSGAEEACPHCWPWHATLKLLGDYQCDGAVISPTWLLTVAHCCILSASNTLSDESGIVLMQLDIPLEYNAAVRPVCLSHSTQTLSSSYLCTVSGWGIIKENGSRARRLQQTRVPVLENEICERNYYFSHPGGITARMLSAGFVCVGGQDSCWGGLGSPLVCKKENGPFTLCGVVSWAVGCASPKKPGDLFKDGNFPGLDKTADEREMFRFGSK
ncbi:LOW QUALITY PROTEIN: ovochymase-1 [Alca torda]